MRYVRMVLINLGRVFALRSRLAVWFLIALFNPLFFFLFWQGSYTEKGETFSGWNLSSVATYYFLLIIASSFLMVHVEDDIAYFDIQMGRLSQYLTKPYSYFWAKFTEEFGWRLLEGIFGMIIFLFFISFFGTFVTLVNTPLNIIFAIGIMICAYMVSFLYKMIIGILSLWITDYSGLQQIVDVLMVVFAGLLMPLEFFPPLIRQISYVLPFSYMIYFPILAFEGKLSTVELSRVLGMQFFWIIVFSFIYKFLWKRGVKLYSGIGQ